MSKKENNIKINSAYEHIIDESSDSIEYFPRDEFENNFKKFSDFQQKSILREYVSWYLIIWFDIESFDRLLDVFKNYYTSKQIKQEIYKAGLELWIYSNNKKGFDQLITYYEIDESKLDINDWVREKANELLINKNLQGFGVLNNKFDLKEKRLVGSKDQ